MQESIESIDIIREHPYATVKVLIKGESVFTFERLSSRISERSLNLILPTMIVREREKRLKRATRKAELKVEKERKEALAVLWEESNDGKKEESNDKVED